MLNVLLVGIKTEELIDTLLLLPVIHHISEKCGHYLIDFLWETPLCSGALTSPVE
jgi:hypothetical protein